MLQGMPLLTAPALSARPSPEAQRRLLVLSLLLWCATLVLQVDGARTAGTDGWASVFAEPPAYLHPRAAIGFDLSGVPRGVPRGVEASLFESVRMAVDAGTRAHTHMSLAVYYKLAGQGTLAAVEKRKGDYWWRVAKF
jgi:hypothetical protein